MKIKVILGLTALACTLAQGGPAFADDDALVLEPSSKWVIDMDPDYCTVQREFGTGKEHLTFQLTTTTPDWGYAISLIGEPAKLKHWQDRQKGGEWVDVSFLPDGPLGRGFAYTAETEQHAALVFNAIHRKLADAKARVNYLNGSDEDYSSAERIYFDGKIAQPIALQTGPLQPVFKLLDQCKWKQVESWGLDVEANRHRTAPPRMKKDRAQAIADRVQADYPSAALRAKAEAQINLRLIVDADGTVTGCKPLSNMSAEKFSDIPCRPFLEQPGLYHPALDAAGKPLASWLIQTVNYFIP